MGNFILGIILPSLFVPFCLMAELEKNVTVPFLMKNWTDARQYCQQNYIDLVTWNTVDQALTTKRMNAAGVTKIWLGLRRDPLNDSAWKWIDVRTGAGITGGDLSNSSYWRSGQQSSCCAFVKNDLMWYSDRCSGRHQTYCLQGTSIQYDSSTVNWNQASQICKTNNMSLTTIITDGDDFKMSGWIGLYRVADNEWRWTGYKAYTYTNWAPGEPSTPDCGSFSANDMEWYSNKCSDMLYFACYDDNLVVVKQNKTWEEALSYCSSMKSACYDPSQPCIYRYHILGLLNSMDFSYVRDRIYVATTDEVWIGLRFLAGSWWWINGQPEDNLKCSWHHNCGSMTKNVADAFAARDCLERKNFVCIRYKIYL